MDDTGQSKNGKRSGQFEAPTRSWTESAEPDQVREDMEVMVQHIETKLYLGANGKWTKGVVEASAFKDGVGALSFCLRKNLRDVRLVAREAATGRESCIYPFGGDPVLKAQRRNVRKAIRESRRLKRARRMLQGRIDEMLAEGMETRRAASGVETTV